MLAKRPSGDLHAYDEGLVDLSQIIARRSQREDAASDSDSDSMWSVDDDAHSRSTPTPTPTRTRTPVEHSDPIQKSSGWRSRKASVNQKKEKKSKKKKKETGGFTASERIDECQNEEEDDAIDVLSDAKCVFL